MSNSPPTFQGFRDDAYYNTIIKHEALGTFIRIYMDDTGIATKVPSLQAHINAVSDVLRIAQEHLLYFKPEKCIFLDRGWRRPVSDSCDFDWVHVGMMMF